MSSFSYLSILTIHLLIYLFITVFICLNSCFTMFSCHTMCHHQWMCNWISLLYAMEMELSVNSVRETSIRGHSPFYCQLGGGCYGVNHLESGTYVLTNHGWLPSFKAVFSPASVSCFQTSVRPASSPFSSRPWTAFSVLSWLSALVRLRLPLPPPVSGLHWGMCLVFLNHRIV